MPLVSSALSLLLVACGGQAPAPAPTAASAASASTPPPVPPPTPAAVAETGKPAFDCAAATSDAEKQVCADPALAALDRRLADVYAQALAAKEADKARLTADQRGWVKGRDDCWKSGDRARCIAESYKTRIVELLLQGGGVQVPSAVEYACDDPGKRFTVVFYNDLDPQAASITWGDDQALVFPMPAASGARYGREGLEFWEHQGEAKVDFYGNALTCRPVGKGAP